MKLFFIAFALLFGQTITNASVFLEPLRSDEAAIEVTANAEIKLIILKHRQGHVQEALDEMRALATKGQAEAMNVLGYWYQVGSGVERSTDEALKYYSQATEKNYAPAMINLAKMKIGKSGASDQDKKDGVQLLLRAYKAGDSNAAISLFHAYTQGAGVPKDLAKAREWATNAVEQKNSEGLWLLYLLNSGKFGKDPRNQSSEAQRALKLAADAGLEKACLELSSAMEKGENTPKNPAGATALLTQTADRGSAEAAYRLAIQLINREGDLGNIVKYLRIGAQQGHPGAMSELGLRLIDGRGCKADPVEAATLLEKASNAGFEPARVNLAELYRSGKGVTKDPKRAVELAMTSLKNGFVPAAAFLAFHFLNDQDADPARACVLAEWASLNGYREAISIQNEAAKLANKESIAEARRWLTQFLTNLGIKS